MYTINNNICPICRLEDDSINRTPTDRDNYFINCPRCKKFIITLEALIEIHDSIPKLSAWIRDMNEKHSDIPEIYRESLEEIAAGIPDRSPREKQIILLQNIERKTEYPGKPVILSSMYDFPLAWASNPEEFVYYVNSLQQRGFIIAEGLGDLFIDLNETGKISDELKFSITMTPGGYDYLEKQERHIEERTQAFVAMSFSPDLKSIYEGPISNAIKKAGYKPYRVDAEPHSERIDFKIISEIKNSRFLIADVTEHKLGVYFEAGYALGLGLPVIWCVRKDHLEKVHFDTRQYNHIVWEAPDDLENKLYDFICAIIGKRKAV